MRDESLAQLPGADPDPVDLGAGVELQEAPLRHHRKQLVGAALRQGESSRDLAEIRPIGHSCKIFEYLQGTVCALGPAALLLELDGGPCVRHDEQCTSANNRLS